MYPCDKDLGLSVKSLEQLSFFEVGITNKILLSPYMMYFVENNLAVASKVQFMRMISTYYKELLQKNY